jgi:GT2 family glycosyltransferase
VTTLPDPQISVVIPTIGRPHLLRKCLESVFGCDPPPSEVLVVDQSGERSTQQLVQEAFEGRVRHISCDGRGIARATNVGLRAASHARVLVTHDDCTVARDWVGVASQVSQADPHGVVTGRVLPPDGSPHVPSTKSSPEPEDFTGRVLTGVLFPSNMCLNRAAVADIGGFDERKGFWYAAEDNDFCYRWLRAGGSLRYEPRMIVWHHDWRTPEQLVRTHISYARSQGVFYAKNLYEYRDRNMLPMLRHELHTVRQELRQGVRNFAHPLVHVAESRPPRWQRQEREKMPYLFIGMIEGWLECRRLRRSEGRSFIPGERGGLEEADRLPPEGRSTPLLPHPVRRFREHLREIRRVAGETQLQVSDARQQAMEVLESLSTHVEHVETLVRRQRAELSRIATQVEALAAGSKPTSASTELAREPDPARQ